jgi:hypothetical protein
VENLRDEALGRLRWDDDVKMNVKEIIWKRCGLN